MIHQAIAKPFGEDEEANRAIGSVLSVVGQLAVESRKLAQTDFRNLNAEHRQREFVNDLRERVESVARARGVDPAEFLEAARTELERRTRRKITIYPGRGYADAFEPDQRRLDGEALAARELRDKLLSQSKRIRDRLADAEAALIVAEQAAKQHRDRQRAS